MNFRASNIHIFKFLRINNSLLERVFVGKRKASRTEFKHRNQQTFRKTNWEEVTWEEGGNSGDGGVLESNRRIP